MEIIPTKQIIKFKSGREIELDNDEVQELKDYYTEIQLVPLHYEKWPILPLITDYPGEYSKLMKPYCTCNSNKSN